MDRSNKKRLFEDVLFLNNEIISFINKNDYGSAAKYLLEQQKKDWKQLADGYKSLESVQTKRFEFDGFEFRIQFNPGRIISSSAKVDAQSIKNRKCFLCFENLPAEQKGILYNNEYLILCNPFPIFPEHFTLPNINHFPQTIKDVFYLLLSSSKDIAKHYMVFYNGPKCGASAPDHLHFQAGSKFFMPIEDEFDSLKKKYGVLLFEYSGFSAAAIDDGMRRFISLESDSIEILIDSFNRFYQVYSSLLGNNDEPMMNILSSYVDGVGWRVIIFLRNKHRPSHYFAEDGQNILISPAAVDIGGVCITPLEKDFVKITKDNLIDIFQEITIGRVHFDIIKTDLKKRLSE
ncbi:MAG: DUF4922 domain-containing protein [Bacteroidetes bacterium]|nr:DUF4922 domain-containing protein [Bacteroidota bacterium]